MKFAFITDENISNAFISLEKIEKVYLKSLENIIEGDIDVFVLSSKIVKFETLLSFCNKTRAKIFYIVSKKDMKYYYKEHLNSLNIYYLPYYFSPNQVLEEVCQYSIENYVPPKKNIIAFFGATEKVGTTNIAQGVSEYLSNYLGLKIFLCFLNGYPSMDYVNEKNIPGGIDSIKINLANDLLTTSDLKNACYQNNNLTIKPSIKNFLYRRHFEPAYIEKLFNVARMEHNIIIADCGSNIELPLVLGALKSACNIYLVTTPQISSLNRFLVNSEFLNIMNITSYDIVLNKYTNDSLSNPDKIIKNYNSKVISCIPYVDYSWNSELLKQTIYKAGKRKYCRAIELLADKVLFDLDIEISRQKRKIL